MKFNLSRRQLAALCVALVGCGTATAGELEDYLLHCGGCHLPDGRGMPPEVPSLRNELGHLVSVPGGRDYLVQVPGAAQAPISDRALTNIINWIMREYNQDTLEPSFVPLSEAEVGTARRNILADPLRRRAELWAAYERRATRP